MQGRSSSTINSFPEVLDIGQGSTSSSSAMTQHSIPCNMLNTGEERFPNFMTSSSEAICAQSASSGESSSRLNLQNDVNDEGLKMEHAWSPFSTCIGAAPRSEERHFESTNTPFPGGPVLLRGSSTNNITYNEGNIGSGRLEIGAHTNGLEREQASSASALSNYIETSSGTTDYLEENDGGSSSSLGTWGLSCKRKALEGTSRQSYPGESSSSFPQPENSLWQADTTCYGPSPSSSLSLSTPAHFPHGGGPREQPNSIISASRRGVGVPSDDFPSSNVTGNFESRMRDWNRIVPLGISQDSVPFSMLSAGSTRHEIIYPTRQSTGPVPFNETFDLSPGNVRTPQGLSHTPLVPGTSGNIRRFPWEGIPNSRMGSLTNSTSRETSAAIRENLDLCSTSRNGTVPAMQIRNSAQDPLSWRLATGNIGTSVGVPSTSRIIPDSSVHSLPNPAQIPHHSSPTENQQRNLEFEPWSLFPSAEAESGVRIGHFYPSSSVPSSSRDAIMPSRSSSQRHRQPNPRSAFSMERLSDEVLGTPRSLRALATDIDGRRRLLSEIRQVLNAMRRAENIRTEDYMLIDPFIHHGMAEFHDRHRDMRLDVDNMSYEELLALEERIGDVSTGLSEDTILKLMRQQKYALVPRGPPSDMEPCCICQEQYADADTIGTLDCGHNFHSNCIKQWLLLKNLCPICKTTALPT